MKKLLFLFTLLVFCACEEEDKSIDPTIMPAATTTGENTLGCLIDGWIYASGRFGKPEGSAFTVDENRYVKIESQVGKSINISFFLVNPTVGTTCSYTNATFDGGLLEDGKAHITRMDGRIISGTFSGPEVTEGRFDVKYQEVEGSNLLLNKNAY